MLRACGATYEDGSLDRMFIVEVLAVASRDEILRRMILEFVVKYYKEELEKILEIVPEKVELRWDDGFEEFLRERKKRKKIATEETLRYYKNLFMKHLKADLLPALKGGGSLWAVHLFPTSIRVYIYHLGAVRGPNPPEAHHPELQKPKLESL
jgi:hypothetical protein